MEDRRKNVRSKLESRILIKRLDQKDQEMNIEVIDVSKTGVGFSCSEPLMIGSVYETFLTIWTKEVLHAFVEIVRIVKEEDRYVYGAIFIGMPELEAKRIEVYQMFEQENQ
ncbi:MAG: PilZ domain-containing protein [Lachnospiraceae bacterium]|nr:PilZ domain-containing protein [Lachnospiraceae bacterium]